MYFKKFGKKYYLFGTEVFKLSFYGIYAFFEVDVDEMGEDYIYIKEIETKEEEFYDTPLYDEKRGEYVFRPFSECYVIKEKTKVYPEIVDGQLAIFLNVFADSLLIQKAKRYSEEEPIPGCYYAFLIAYNNDEDYERVSHTRYLKETITKFVN